jgi:cysteine desulfurase
VVVSAIEHHAVGYAAERWGRLGCDVSVVGVDARGRVRLDELSQLLTPRTVLVSCMLANNEVGTVEPVAEVARLAHAAGALCHTDAVQAFGHIAVDVRALGVDLLSLSGHKFHGPKGVGALYVRRGVELASFIVGGGQERGLRAGTENVAGCVALATAARLSCRDVEATRAKLAETRDWFVAELARRAGGIELVGDAVERLPGNVNVCVEGVAGRALVMSLAGREVYASAGSACSAGAVKPSFVQLALGRTPTQAASAVRFSFDETTPRDDLELALEIIPQEISRLRSLT